MGDYTTIESYQNIGEDNRDLTGFNCLGIPIIHRNWGYAVFTPSKIFGGMDQRKIYIFIIPHPQYPWGKKLWMVCVQYWIYNGADIEGLKPKTTLQWIGLIIGSSRAAAAEVTDEGLGFGNPKALFAYACCAQKLRCMCGILDPQWCWCWREIGTLRLLCYGLGRVGQGARSACSIASRVRNGAGSELWEAAVTGDVQTVCYWLYVECGGAP